MPQLLPVPFPDPDARSPACLCISTGEASAARCFLSENKGNAATASRLTRPQNTLFSWIVRVIMKIGFGKMKMTDANRSLLPPDQWLPATQAKVREKKAEQVVSNSLSFIIYVFNGQMCARLYRVSY
ncbi:MAG: hypothetical protein MZV49_05030 [Rhodopseudomonas palustris]|nr:hypothetical protein [Rhodopseudomonas palustris]